MIKKVLKLLFIIASFTFICIALYSFFINPSADKKRVKIALDYAQSHDMNTNIIMLCDFSKPSGTRRFIVYDTKRNKTIFSSLCDQGKGKGFSNQSGSFCSSLGFYKVCGQHKMRVGVNSFVLQGLSSSNSNAMSRGILIHPWHTVPDLQTYPLPILYKASKGCFVLSPIKYKMLRTIIRKNSNKPILLYAYN